MSGLDDRVSILAVPGSLRHASYNRAVLEAAAQLSPEDAEVTVFNGLDDIPVFNEDIEHVPEAIRGVARLRKAVAAADGLLIATPEYNQSMPGVVKNMVDWLSRGEPHEGLAGLPVAVTGATTGPWGTRIAQALLKQTLHSSQALVLPAPALFIARVDSLVDQQGRLADEQVRIRIRELVVAFADWIRIVEPASTGAGTRASGFAGR